MPLPGTYRTAGSLARRSQDTSLEDEQSLIGSLRDNSIGTLAAVGNVLDLPGSIVRDVLSGENPLDQLLPWNWTSANNRVSGRKMLRNIGLASRRDSVGNFLGGLGTEILLDPLTYLTFGASALSKGGQVAKRAGLLGDVGAAAARKSGKAIGTVGKRESRLTTTLDDLLQVGGEEAAKKARTAADNLGLSLDAVRKEKIGGMVGIGLPFMDPVAVKGTGAVGMARKLDDIGHGIRHARIPGTESKPIDALHRLFDAKIHGMKNPITQAVFRRGFDKKIEGMSDVHMASVKMANDLAESGLSEEGIGDVLRMMTEGVKTLPESVRGNIMETIKGISPEQRAALQAVANDARKLLEPMIAQGRKIGKKTQELSDEAVDYFPRFLSEALGRHPMGDKRAATGFDVSNLQRLDVFRDMPGGTVGVKNLAKDEGLRNLLRKEGVQAKDVQEYLELKHPWIPDSYRVLDADSGEWIAKESGRIKAMASKLGSLSDETLAAGIYGNHPLRDLEARLLSARNADENIKLLAETLAQPGVLRPASGTVRNTDGMQLRDLARELGVKWGTEDAGEGFGEFLRSTIEEVRGRKAIGTKDLGALRVDPEVAADLTRYMKRLTGNDEIDEWLKVIDGVTNFGKASWTSIWPAFHVRNRVSGLAWNFMKGITSLQAEQAGRAYMKGQPVKMLKDLPQVQEEWAKRQSAQAAAFRAAELQKAAPNAPAPVGGGLPPKSGVVVANIGQDGKIYYGAPGDAHYSLSDKFGDNIRREANVQPGQNTWVDSGFADSTGRFMDREEALKVVRGEKPKFRSHLGNELDAVDLAEQGPHAVARKARTFKPQQMTDKDAFRIFNEMVTADGVVTKHNSYAMDIAGEGGLQQGTLADMLSGQVQPGTPTMSVPKALKMTVGRTADTTLNPRRGDIRGIRGATESTLGPFAAGEYVGNYVEGLNRVAPYIELLRKGHSRSEAARIVGETQIQYANKYYTPFEQQVMKRLLPFYSFSSRMFPQVVKELTQKPGGRLGATIRAQRLAQGSGDIAPDYIRETASIPLGRLSDGSDRYLTGLGLMHEDPFSFGPNMRQAGLEFLSRMNPFIKAPLELVTGQSFFQKGPTGGRPLEDMDPLIGRLMSNVAGRDEPVKLPQWMEQVAANSPAARLLSTARQISDPRKRESMSGVPMDAMLLNLLTGVRIQDVSTRSRDAIVRDLLTQQMKNTGAANFDRVYFRKEDLERMSPAEREQAERLQALINILAKRAKERKLAAENAN